MKFGIFDNIGHLGHLGHIGHSGHSEHWACRSGHSIPATMPSFAKQS